MTAPDFAAEQQAAVARGIARANALTNIAAAEAAPGTLQAARSEGEPPPVPAPLGATIAPEAAGLSASGAPCASGVSADREAAAGPLARVTAPDAPTLFDAPAARATDPATSHQAAASITTDKRRAIHAQVLTLLLDGPLTDFDLAAHTGLKQTSVGKRRHELCTVGLVCEHDRAGISDTGSACCRWALTAAGRMEAARMAVAA